MNAARALMTAMALSFIALPVLMPFREILGPEVWLWSEDDGKRIFLLAVNTLLFTLASTLLALPLGTVLAVLLFRTHFFARRFFLLLLGITLFVPLPILVTSWQGLLGTNGWFPVPFWRGDDRPWATGWGPAIWIQTLAALPWVTGIVGIGLTWVEPEREEEAAQTVGPWQVLLRVTLPRATTSILAAGLFSVLHAASEISVTDMMLISTLAEETHTQFTLGERAALGRTFVLFLPALVLTWGIVLVTLNRLEKTLPPLVLPFQAHRPLDIGAAAVRFMGSAAFMGLLTAPLLSLVWKLGVTGYPPHWSSAVAWHHWTAEARLLGGDLQATLITALGSALLCGVLALLGCWLARECPWFRWLLFSVLTWAWVLPGPILGIGLHEVIMSLVVRFPEGPLASLLYDGPSPAPLIWAQVIRTLPVAMLFLWPIVRMIPRELFEAARMEGAGASGEFTHVVWPMTWRAALVTGFASWALCLGEVSASLRVETPAWQSYTKLLFDRMHYGAENNLAALELLMLASLIGLALVIFVAMKGINGFKRLAGRRIEDVRGPS